MLKVVGAAGVLLIGQAQVGVPPWLYMVVTLIGSGVFVRYYMARWEKRVMEASARKTGVETDELEDKIRRDLIEDTEKRLAIMRADLATTREDLQRERALRIEERADADRRIAAIQAEAERKNQILRTKIEHLLDEVAALRAGEETGKRREDEGS